MAENILRLKVQSEEYDAKLKQAAQGLTRYADECRKVGGTLEVVEKETLDYVRALGQMDTTSRTATGKLAEMKKTFTELSVVYKNMTDEEKNSPFGKALATSLDQLKGRIGESKVQLDDINKSINGGGGLTGALDNMLGKVGLNVEGLMKFGGAAGAATTALKVAKDAFFASETSLDEWGRTVQSSQSLYQGFLSALNNSDISGFLSRIDEIVSAARDAYNAMDELGTFSAFQQRNVAKGRAGYAQALDEYRLKPTADNKQKLAQANQMVMNNLRESYEKTEAAYQAALRQIATERISGKGMQDAFVKMFSEGNYGDLQAAKSSYKTGRGLNSGAQYYHGDRVYDGRVQDRTTGKWRDMSDTEKQQFEFARALSQVNDSQIKEVQALGAQSVAITEQIYQQDRAYNRLSGNNAPLRVGGGKGSSKTNLPEYADFSKLLFKNGSQDLQAEAPFMSVFSMLKGKSEFDPENILGSKDAWEAYKDTITGSIGSIGESMNNLSFDGFQESYEKVGKDVDKLTKSAKQQQMAFGMAGQAADNLGAALAGMDDPAARAAGTVISAIANIALGFGQAVASAGSMGPWAWLAYVAAGTAALATTISTVHSLTGYAQGGIVKGNSYSGDNIYGGPDAMVNAGELVLTKAQQSTLASQLQEGGMRNMNLSGRIRGTDIILSVDRTLSLEGKQLLTWGR